MVLQRIIFPSKNKPEKLYFRKKGEIISFDTFFNAFSVFSCFPSFPGRQNQLENLAP